MSRKLYERGDRVEIINTSIIQEKLGFRVGQVYPVWCDYEDLIYLQSPVKSQTSEDWFLPNQLEKAK
jgi:hypothetical protein